MILIDKSSSPTIIYDFDSTLSFPVSAIDYLRLAIRDEIDIDHKYHRYILIEYLIIENFLLFFAVHM